MVAIAVVDEAGHLIACDRMDGALWVTPEIARAKANAAAGFRASTLDLEERFTKRHALRRQRGHARRVRVRLRQGRRAASSRAAV